MQMYAYVADADVVYALRLCGQFKLNDCVRNVT